MEESIIAIFSMSGKSDRKGELIMSFRALTATAIAPDANANCWLCWLDGDIRGETALMADRSYSWLAGISSGPRISVK